MGLMGLIRASYGGLEGILTGLTKSTDHPSGEIGALQHQAPKGPSSRPYVGGCQNWDPLLGPLTTRCCLILGTK